MSASNDPAGSTSVNLTERPPTTIFGIVQRLGPGLIIAGSIVGSGELIATTKTGAEAGFTLLWLILIGCVIKVFCQVELGRYTIVTGRTTLDAFSDVPGPRIAGRANWLTAFWLVMFLISLGQLGGIAGGVGQALQISCPITEQGRLAVDQSRREIEYAVLLAEDRHYGNAAAEGDDKAVQRSQRLDQLGRQILDERRAVAVQQIEAAGNSDDRSRLEQLLALFDQRLADSITRPEQMFDESNPDVASLPTQPVNMRAMFKSLGKRSSADDRIWASIVTVITAVALVLGRYGLIQSFSTVLVAGFTFVTVLNVIMLQLTPTWNVRLEDIVEGLSFRLPSEDGTVSTKAIATALATFGIIGVGANELIQYPYWCVEKGYARFVGPHDASDGWLERARGWMRVLRWDAWCSMVVYTFATLAFYLCGAAILGRTGLNPAGPEMIQTLSVMYEPVFGTLAKWVFLFGAFAVLYSTFFVATAGHARVFPEGIQAFGIGPRSRAGYESSVRFFSGVFPFLCLAIYLVFPSQPEVLILLSGTMQGIMLPMLAGAALYFRYRRGDQRLAPGRAWDVFLWLSAAGMLITGAWSVWSEISRLMK